MVCICNDLNVRQQRNILDPSQGFVKLSGSVAAILFLLDIYGNLQQSLVEERLLLPQFITTGPVTDT